MTQITLRKGATRWDLTVDGQVFDLAAMERSDRQLTRRMVIDHMQSQGKLVNPGGKFSVRPHKRSKRKRKGGKRRGS